MERTIFSSLVEKLVYFVFSSNGGSQLIVFSGYLTVLLFHLLHFFVEVLFIVFILEDADRVYLTPVANFHAGVDRLVVSFGDLAAQAVVKHVECGTGVLLSFLPFRAGNRKMRAKHNS